MYSSNGRYRKVGPRNYNARQFVAKAPAYRRGYVKGRGDYKSFFKSVGKGIQSLGKRFIPSGTFSKLGGLGGAAIGARLGNAAIGSKFGSLAGSGLSRLVGFGDYRVKKNTLMPSGGGDPPVINNGLRSNIIRHREYICDIVSSSNTGAFNLQSFPINPGLFATFPWLSGLAAQYQEYMFRGLIFEYKTTSADALNSTNTALGTVVLATDYNVLNGNFTTKSQMENSDFSASSKPSCDIIHPVECDPRQTPVDRLFVRGGSVASADLRFNDLGNFQIATVGFQGTSVNCGELWASYEVEFFKPILPAGANGPVDPQPQTSHWLLTGVTNAKPLGSGTASFVVPNSGNTPSYINGVNQTINLVNLIPGAYYMLYVNWTGGATAVTCPSITLTSSLVLTAYNILQNGSSNSVNTTNGTTSSQVLQAVVFQYTGQSPVATSIITLGTSGTLPTSVTSGDLFLMQLSDSITV